MIGLDKFFQLSTGQRYFLLEAIIFLALARLAILLLPFRYVARSLGTCMAETPRQSLLGRVSTVRTVAWAVEVAARHVPWKAVCLPRAVAAKFMLRRRSIGSTLYLGVVGGDGAAAATRSTHAWLRVGDMVVIGGADSDVRYVVVATFA